MTNIERTEKILQQLAACGLREIVICAGARNSPLVTVLTQSQGFRIFHHFEERAAGFFAVGRARALSAPVAVVATSGTAAAELLPAAMEAFYSGVPLILITADRPRSYRGSGAPQCVEQKALFEHYVSMACDLDENDNLDLSRWKSTAPLHLNLCFAEPLIDATPSRRGFEVSQPCPSRQQPSLVALTAFLQKCSSPLVIVGALDAQDRMAVSDFLNRLQAPIYAEGVSGIREATFLAPYLLTSGERVVNEGRFDGVLRLGGVPTLRFWRDLETLGSSLPVFSLSRLPFSGLARQSGFLHCDSFECLYQVTVRPSATAHEQLYDRDRRATELLGELCQEEPCSEPALIAALSRLLPNGSHVYLGNSLPIREWDLMASREDRHLVTSASRGVNGIDGQLSTFFGLCLPERENWAIVGDLTALYDLTAPWVLPQLEKRTMRIAIINNGGGKIFSRLFHDPVFENRHHLSFESWAKMWSLAYMKVTSFQETVCFQNVHVVEVVPDEEATERFWNRYDAVWR